MKRLIEMTAISFLLLPTCLDAFEPDPVTPAILNNLVTELVNARQQKRLGAKTIRFTASGVDWYHIAVEGPATLRLDDESRPLCAGHRIGDQSEAMRHLTAGAHKLAITGHPSG